MAETSHQTEVRALRESDREAWGRLWSGYLAFYRARVPDEVTERTFRGLCGGEEGRAGLVAVDDGDTAIGIAHLLYHASTWDPAGYCYLEDLFVDRGHRGGDLGRALIEAAVEDAAGRGVRRVYWHAQQFNGAARSLYDTVGRLTSFIMYERESG